MPHDAFHPLKFQVAYLKKLNGQIPEEVINCFDKLRNIALSNNVSFEELAVYALSPSDPSQSNQAQAEFPSPANLEGPEDKTREPGTNDVQKTSIRIKPELVSHAAEEILRSCGTVSSFCKCLLELKLSTATGVPLLRDMLAATDEQLIEAHKPNNTANKSHNFIYSFLITADTSGASLSRSTVEQIWKFAHLQPGDQLLILVELRNVLETWAMDKTWCMRETEEAMLYDLPNAREELRKYFQPQQWNEERKPTAAEMYELTHDLYSGKTRPRSILGALAWCVKAAQLGHARAQDGVGYFIEQHEDYSNSLKWYRKSAVQNDLRGLADMGRAYLWGRGVKKNIAAALKYFKAALKAGHENVAGDIGVCYLKLRGKQNYAKARRYFDSALAVQPEGYVFYHIAEMHKHGWGVKKSPAVAESYYTRATDAGYTLRKKTRK